MALVSLTATNAELESLAGHALQQRNFTLFDQATSERLARPAGAVDVANHQVVDAVMQALPWRCPLCGRIRRAFGQVMLAKFQQREYCHACWTGEQVGRAWYGPWEHARRRLKYLDAALEQGFREKALQFPEDAPQRRRLRLAYRRCEHMRTELRAQLERAVGSAPVVTFERNAR